MKLQAIKDVRIRTEDGVKRDFKKWDTVELHYFDSVQFFLARWFKKIETKDMEDTVTAESIQKDKEEEVKKAKKTAWTRGKKTTSK